MKVKIKGTFIYGDLMHYLDADNKVAAVFIDGEFQAIETSRITMPESYYIKKFFNWFLLGRKVNIAMRLLLALALIYFIAMLIIAIIIAK